jgi:hypothetical protein
MKRQQKELCVSAYELLKTLLMVSVDGRICRRAAACRMGGCNDQC